MGQYYKYLVIDKNNKAFSIDSWAFDHGAKLMEHSWVGNSYVNSCINHIYKNPCKVAWIGDYSEAGDHVYNDKAKDFQQYYVQAWRSADISDNTVLANNIEFNSDNTNYFLVNHTKKIYIDLAKYTELNQFKPAWSELTWCINPLPLLTACGNGLGVGDYFGKNMDTVGSWALDEIEFTDEKPTDYKEVNYTFEE